MLGALHVLFVALLAACAFSPSARAWALPICVTLSMFLVLVHSSLRGRMSSAASTFLGLVWLALLVWSFIAFGWGRGALVFVISFVVVGILRPLTFAVAANAMGKRA